MSVRMGEWFAGLTGAWLLAASAIFALVVCLLPLVRSASGAGGERLRRVSLIVLVVAIGYWLVDHSARREATTEQQTLEARAFELSARALVPGSPLACLVGAIGESIEEACERTLFASPETTAAAVAYVAAQLSLLADAREEARRGGPTYGSSLTNVRRMIEADRFGIVAHVLEVRDGCTRDQCAAFGFLQGTGRVSANLAERPFEAHLKSHMAAWQSAGARTGAAVAPAGIGPAASVAPMRPPASAYFPSAASIPQVNIMTAEPAPVQASRETAAAAAGTEPSAGRKPALAPAPARQPSSSNSAPAANTPLQLGPAPQ